MGTNGLQQLSTKVLSRPHHQPAIEYERRWFSWGEFNQVANQVNDLIRESGAEADSKLVLIAKNRPSALAAYLGLIAQGYAFRMVYPFQSAASLIRELERVRPSVVIAAEETFNTELQHRMQIKGIAGIALFDGDKRAPLNARMVPGLEHAAIEASRVSAPAIEILTSGTTGAPKPFALDYNTVAEHIVGGRRTPSSEGLDPEQLPPILMYFPVGNITGLHSIIAPLLRGQKGVLLDRFCVSGWHDHLKRYRPQAAGLPPAAVQMLLEADLPKEDFACLKMIGSGSAPLDPGVQKAFEERYGVPILIAYGATEFGGPVVSMTPEIYARWGQKKPGSVGLPMTGAKIRIVDPDTGALLDAGGVGVLEVVSPRMGAHWIRTADLGYIDEDGFLFLCGRNDGAIMRGGFKVLPETIEKALLLHPSIAAAGVIGIPDHRLGQVPAAALELKSKAAEPSIHALEEHLRGHLNATHIPVKWRFVSELPRTASHKVHQPSLRKLFE